MARIYARSKVHDAGESDDLVWAMAADACRHARMVFDEELGSVPVAVAEGAFRRPSAPYWDQKGAVLHNRLADVIRDDLHARTIDGAMAYWDGRWVFGRRAIEQVTYLFTDELSQRGRAEVAAHVADNVRMTPQTDSGRDYDGLVYVQFENGTYRVSADAVEAVEPTPDMLVVGRILVRYANPGENAADAFLNGISCRDDDVRAALEEVVGACTTAAHVASKSIVLQGGSWAGGAVDASNGKSTFVNLLKGLLGSQNVTCVSPEAIGGRFQSASVLGKLALLADDINPDALGHRRNSAFKQIVSGNTIHTDIKNKDGCDFTPLATTVLSLNGHLDVREMDGGLKRRLLFVPFRAHFREGTEGCDGNAAARLMRDPEALQRLAWFGMRVLQRLVRNHGYTHIDASDEMLEEVRVEGDSVAAWVRDEGIDYLRDVHGQATTHVYGRFREWCDRHGWEEFPNEQVFSRRLARDEGLVMTIRAEVEAGLVEAPGHWRLKASLRWDAALRKAVRRYGLAAS